MGFLMDPPNRRGASPEEQVRYLVDWAVMCTEKLNTELNSLTSKNFASAEAKALSQSIDSGLGDFKQRMIAISASISALTTAVNDLDDRLAKL